MSLLIKIALSFGAVLLLLGSTCVIIAALFTPKEYNEGKPGKSDIWDESIEDV